MTAFKKKCNIFQLTVELKEAGYSIDGVSEEHRKDGWFTTVHVRDDETKDVTPMVEAHVPEPDTDSPTKAIAILYSMIAQYPFEEENLRFMAKYHGVDYDAVAGPKVPETAKGLLIKRILEHKRKVEELKVLRKAMPIKKVIKPVDRWVGGYKHRGR